MILTPPMGDPILRKGMRGGVGGGRGEQEEGKEGELCLACKMNFSKKM